MNEQLLVDKINVDDIEYVTSELPDQIKGLVSLYQEAQAKVVEHQRGAAMMDAARRALGDNVVNAVRQWNAQRIKELQAAQAAANAAPVAAPVVEAKPAAVKARKLKAVTNESPDAVQ
jgi:CHASE3 domain sensor protein